MALPQRRQHVRRMKLRLLLPFLAAAALPACPGSKPPAAVLVCRVSAPNGSAPVKEDLDERGIAESELASDMEVISRERAFELFQENDFSLDF